MKDNSVRFHAICLFISEFSRAHRNADSLGESGAVVGVNLEDQLQEALLDGSLSSRQRA